MVVTADGGGKEKGAGNVVVQWYVLGGDSPWAGDSPMGGWGIPLGRRGPQGIPPWAAGDSPWAVQGCRAVWAS